MRTNLLNKPGLRVLLLLVAALLGGAVFHGDASAATVTVDLCATPGTATMPDGTIVSIWGYTEGACTVTTASLPGGPTIYANEGDDIAVTLHNNLGEDTALLFRGQAMIPDLTGAAANGGTKTYTFTATNPGTFLYEAGLLDNAQHQVAMGLYGALVVRPVDGTLAPILNQAYASADTTFEDEAVLVLSEIDPALNNSATPASFDLRAYAPRYRLINGKAYPATDGIAVTAVGDRVLLRYVNAGLEHHSMGLLGLHQTVVANDGSPLLFSHTVVADTLAPGETQDAIATIPATSAGGSKFALYDASFLLQNSSAAGAGGMLTFLTAGTSTPPGADVIGPAASGVTLNPALVSAPVDVTLNASVSDAASGGSTIAAAEYYIDSTAGTAVAMSATDGAFDSVTEAIRATIPAATVGTLTTGNHAIYVRGQDSAGNWGPFSSAVLKVDNTGPVTGLLTLAPNPSNGTVAVALSGTANDSASGGSNIQVAEYTIDGGTAIAMSVNAASPVANLTATISAATVADLVEGTHAVSVRSQDALGNWGSFATIDLIVDKTGPDTTNVSAVPNPTNGVAGFNPSVAAVRVFAHFTDAASKVNAGEGFIDAVGANGTGFIFVASDGALNSPSEDGYADVPLTTIRSLSEGPHTISVHGKDAAGNWGPINNTLTLTIDKTSPTLSNVTLVPSTIAFGTASVTLNVAASDNAGGTGVAGGQYWIDGTATPPANATSFTGTTVLINTSTVPGGNHVVYARVRDAAGNWSTVLNTGLVVVQAVDDSVTVSANNQTTQVVNIAAPGVLANDQPVGAATLTGGPTRIDASGNLGTITVTCPPSTATGICSNGSYRITLNGVGATGPARAASKRGTFTFTYAQTINGVTSNEATVTITVN